MYLYLPQHFLLEIKLSLLWHFLVLHLCHDHLLFIPIQSLLKRHVKAVNHSHDVFNMAVDRVEYLLKRLRNLSVYQVVN